MNNEIIEELEELTFSHNKQLLVNDQFICYFIAPDYVNSMADVVECSCFSNWKREDTCPRFTREAKVKVYDYSKFKSYDGLVTISKDYDLNNMRSMSLYYREDGEDNWTCMRNVVTAEIQDKKVSVKEFIKLLKYQPLYAVKEPEDSLGLEVCQFKEYKNCYPNIEIGVDGKLYYEILDQTGYEEGKLIPMNSPMRKDVIMYEPLTLSSMCNLADRINASLDRLYNS